MENNTNPFEIVDTTNLGSVNAEIPPQTNDTTVLGTEEVVTEVFDAGDLSLVPEQQQQVAQPEPEVVETEDFTKEVQPEVVEEEAPNINAYYAAQVHLKEEGLLSEEDLKEDATWEDVQLAFEKRVKPKVEQEVVKRLEAMGVNEQNLMYAQMIQRNQSVEEANELHTLGRIAALKDVPDLTEDQKMAIVGNMYNLKGYAEKDRAKLLENAKEDLDSYYDEALGFHTDLYSEKLAQEKAANEARQLEIENHQIQAAQKLQKILKDREVLGVNFSPNIAKKLEKDIYARDVEYEYQGQKRYGSKVDAFYADFYNSDEQKLLTYLRHNYPEEFEASVKTKAKKDLTKEILKSRKVQKRKPVSQNEDDYIPSWTSA